jgi:hypothetical protein
MARKNVLGQGSAFDDDVPSDNPFALSLDAFNPHLQPSGFKPSGGEMQRLREEVEQLKVELQNRAAAPQTALVTAEDGSRVLGRFRLTRTALIIPDDVTQDELQIMGDLLQQMHGAMQFWIGDFANIFHDRHGVMYDALAEYFSVDKSTLENWAWVCRKIEKSLRNDLLGFSHHYAVAGLPDNLKGRETELLDYAAQHSLNVMDFRRYIKSLLPVKAAGKQVSALFDKARVPRPTALRAIYLKARKGDERARLEMQRQIAEYEKWLREIQESLGLK